MLKLVTDVPHEFGVHQQHVDWVRWRCMKKREGWRSVRVLYPAFSGKPFGEE
jgi:hypothetical protein